MGIFSGFLGLLFLKPQKVFASSKASESSWSLSKEEWKSKLDLPVYQILREEGTERPFTSELNNEKRKGIFHCAGCDLPLFSSASIIVPTLISTLLKSEKLIKSEIIF